VTTTRVRFGKQGRSSQSDVYVSTKAIQSLTEQMNQATDGAWPFFRLDYPCLLQPRQSFRIELQDTVTGADRIVNTQLVGYLPGAEPGKEDPYVISERVTVPDSGTIVKDLQSDQDRPMIITGFGLWIEETGTAAKNRGLLVKLLGGAMPDWMEVRVPATCAFPHRNAGAQVHLFDPALVLNPGEAFEAEFFDIGGSNVSVHLGLIGYAEDRRS
jgi:hypothetical protein